MDLGKKVFFREQSKRKLLHKYLLASTTSDTNLRSFNSWQESHVPVAPQHKHRHRPIVIGNGNSNGITIAIDIAKSGSNSKTTAATTNVIISGAVVIIIEIIIWGLVETVVSLLLGTAA